MRIFKVEIIMRAVKVGGHDRDKVRTILFIIITAQFNCCNFGNCIGLVSGFEGPGQEIFFFERLGGRPWINA